MEDTPPRVEVIDEEEVAELSSVAERVNTLAVSLEAVLDQQMEDAVYWMEVAGRTPKRVSRRDAQVASVSSLDWIAGAKPTHYGNRGRTLWRMIYPSSCLQINTRSLGSLCMSARRLLVYCSLTQAADAPNGFTMIDSPYSPKPS